MAQTPHTNAKNTAIALLREARAIGWARAKVEIKPDGSVTVDTGMIVTEDGDDFLKGNLRMGE
ncbi:hypothetical protein FGG78_24160 [Thioclava sp. BHET1]|nr:hypothetical protein FGG78_24160 [Thioclava sp. BHET1]